ncbi:eukaryotic translation initiation factor 3 subunit K isoform X2 [Polistes fuscatus]|uniref:eukaryotic translation initiation factor 3 subunit K isoform X2 n=1 Tax=Polistes canadensis TaxID=91411 RepID=UPI000718FD52|nr:PREDICTED: eukaryotic translation initiation factor 3 subunit K isoform X2 [Polistes canadensis]XP_043486853.1 eukaryotic translation initiation factor 3 subunit K isoform X2 [Polistes fuscatus]
MYFTVKRYNPDNLTTLEKYVEIQSRENVYDLEPNLAVLKLYQLNPNRFNMDITCQILLKALTNLPHTDFVLCKCLLNESIMQEKPINQIMYLGDILEQCDFEQFWDQVLLMSDLCDRIVGFQDSIRKFVCHVVGITFQTIDKGLLVQLLGGVDDNTLKHWVKKYGWKDESKSIIFIANQDENIKTKNITEKIDFENVAGLMAACL